MLYVSKLFDSTAAAVQSPFSNIKLFHKISSKMKTRFGVKRAKAKLILNNYILSMEGPPWTTVNLKRAQILHWPLAHLKDGM